MFLAISDVIQSVFLQVTLCFTKTAVIFWDIIIIGIAFFGLLLFSGHSENIYTWNTESTEGIFFLLSQGCLQGGL